MAQAEGGDLEEEEKMGDFGDAIKHLYDKFILRDVLSFVTPGAIVTLTTFIILKEPSLNELLRYSRDIHWLLYIPLFGLFFVVGFSVQCLGVFLGCIRLHKIDKSDIKQRFKMLFGKLQEKDDCSGEARGKVISFINSTASHDWARQHCERSVILKQMCANNLFAFIIAGVFLWVSFCNCKAVYIGVPSFVAVMLLFSLYFGYRSSEIAVDTIEDKVRELDKKGKLNKDK